MISMKQNGLGIAGVLGAMAALCVVACGDDFTGEDCKVDHTCPAVGGGPGAEGGAGSGEGDAGSGAVAGEGEAEAGAGAGRGGAAATGCSGLAECDDGNAANGLESCGADGMCVAGNPPPSVLAITPENDATAVATDAEIVITFSEALDPATVTSDSIQLLDGDTPIAGETSYADEQVTFTPSTPLALIADYTVKVTTLVTDAEGAALLEDHDSTFSTRDGAWHVTDIATTVGDARIVEIAATLPITEKGDVLSAWVARSADYSCPTSARWVNRGVAKGSAVQLTASDIKACKNVAVGANAAGVAAVVWQEEFEHAKQFRDSSWSATKQHISSVHESWNFAAAVAPDGAVTFIQSTYNNTRAWRTDAAGVWNAAFDDLRPTTGTANSMGRPSIAFDGEGNGWAAWVARNGDGFAQIMVSRFESGAQKWGPGAVVTNSVPVNSTDFLGSPAVAIDREGNAMVAWVRGAGGSGDVGGLVASRHSGGSWSPPQVVKASQVLNAATDAPGLVFDGSTFVAAFLNKSGSDIHVYSARFDRDLMQWDFVEPRSDANVRQRMPRLGADAHGNLLLTWLEPTADAATLMFARFTARASTWSSGAPVAEALVEDTGAKNRPLPLGVNAGGLAAVMWADADAQDELTTVRLASFY